MKKRILLIIPFLMLGCEKIPDAEITNPVSSYQLSKISAPDEFVFSQTNKKFTAVLEFASAGGIEQVYFDIYSPSGKQLNTSAVQMKDDGDLKAGDLAANDQKYSGIFQFPDTNANGQYKLYFYIRDNQKTTKAALHFIKLSNFDNGAPVISNLSMPDTVSVGTDFTFTLKAEDPNGLDDIDRVFFLFSSATGDVVDFMHDDANSNFGDKAAHDGIFSYKSHFTEQARGQDRIFTFQAHDRGGALSNIITHKIYVK